MSPSITHLAGLGAVSAFVSLTHEAPLDTTRRQQERVRCDLAIAAARRGSRRASSGSVADLENAFTRAQSAERRIALAAQTRAIAEQQLAAETARYATGSGTVLQVREAEDALLTWRRGAH